MSIGKHVLGLESEKLFGIVLQHMMFIAPPPPPRAHMPVAKKPKNVVAVNRRRVVDFE
jgi:hypothetical protein